MSFVRDAALGEISLMPPMTTFTNKDLYQTILGQIPAECQQRGYAHNEPRFHNDVRRAICDAKGLSLVHNTGNRGQHQRN